MVLPGTSFSHVVKFKDYEPVFDKRLDPSISLAEQQVVAPQYAKGAKQSVPVPNSQSPGYSHVYRSAHSPEHLVTALHPSINTVKDYLETASSFFPNTPALGERHYDKKTDTWSPYEFETYSQVRERVLNLASGLVGAVEKSVGINPSKEQYNVGFYGPNSRNWYIADMACVYSRICSVALYDTLGKDSTEYIVTLTEMPAIFASVAHIPFLLSIKSRLPNLKIIISFNSFDETEGLPANVQKFANREQLTAQAKSAGVVLYDITDLERNGKQNPVKLTNPSPEDVYTLNFTSGTTGNHPKGVILTHKNIVSGSTSVLYKEYVDTPDPEQQAYLSFLPLAHIYERMNLLNFTLKSIRIGFIHGDIAATLFEDIRALKPHLICGVPRIWNKLAAQLRSSTIEAPGEMGRISRLAYQEKLKVLHESGQATHPKWDSVWTDKLRESLGFDRTRTIATGAAPLAADNIELLSVALGVDILQGYGLTETTSGFAVSKRGDLVRGSNGPVVPNAEVRLRDLPELGYRTAANSGEIMIRGPQVFRGYYKNEAETVKSFDSEGWFHTGDVGRIDELGRIFIVDRVKNILKLAQGEYVSPERIEALYLSSSSLLDQIFLDGNSHERYLVAIIGVNLGSYSAFLKAELGLDISSTDTKGLTDTFSRKEVRTALLRQINHEARQAGVQGFETAKNAALFIEPLSFQNGTLTPTMKLRRIPARKYFAQELKDLYKEGPLVESSKI